MVVCHCDDAVTTRYGEPGPCGTVGRQLHLCSLGSVWQLEQCSMLTQHQKCVTVEHNSPRIVTPCLFTYATTAILSAVT